MAVEWKIGDRIYNRWLIHNILKGGMGLVYVVIDERLHDVFAAKTFQDEIFAKNATIAERFNREANSWVNLDVHPNVTHGKFVYTLAGKPFIFLEYVSGGDLAKWIGTSRLTEDLPQVLRFAIQFCDGMIHVLSKGITAHRDIKPTNCLITEDKVLKITDFGLAKVIIDAETNDAGVTSGGHSNQVSGKVLRGVFRGRNRTSSSGGSSPMHDDAEFTRTGAGAGTPHYMAPEQFDDVKHVDVRADIYSFGVMLYEMITGKLPFVSGTWEQYKRLHQTEAPPKLKTGNAKLDEIVQSCLSKEPAKRFENFTLLRDRLAQVYTILTGEDPPRPAVSRELDAREWSNKGVSFTTLGMPTEAIVCYDKALVIDPRDVKTLYLKGDLLATLGHATAAIDCFDRLIAIDPRHAMPWQRKGELLVDLQCYREAVNCFDTVQRLGFPPPSEIAWCVQKLRK